MKVLKILVIWILLIYVLWYVYRRFIKMKFSLKGIEWLKKAEGYSRKPYKDSRGLWTIGVGHLIKANEQYLLTKTLTDKEVNDLLMSDIALYEKEVNECILFPMTQYEFDAMVSFAFNIGYGRIAGGTTPDESGFSGSNVELYFNARKDKQTIANAFMGWHKPAEIIPRRAKEAVLFKTGNYDYYNMSVDLYQPYIKLVA